MRYIKSMILLILLVSAWTVYLPLTLADDIDKQKKFQRELHRAALDAGVDISSLSKRTTPQALFNWDDADKSLMELALHYGATPFSHVGGDSQFMSAMRGKNYEKSRYLLSLQRTFRRPSDGPSSLDELQKFIKDRKIKDISSLLSQLPNDFKKGYVLMYDSKSLQSATDNYPRVIMFGGTGNLIIAFNGDPSQRGYHELEAIEFDWSSLKYKFQEFNFDPEVSPNVPVPSSINPQKCTTCHLKSGRTSEDMRPNFNPYFLWPGAYGSNNDNFLNRDGMNKHTRDTEKEETALYQFVNKDHSGTRYMYLPSFSLTKNIPNKSFTKLVYFQNSFRIANNIRNSPQYEQYKFLIQMILKQCPFEWDDVLKLKSRYNADTVLKDLDSHVREMVEKIAPDNFSGRADAEHEPEIYLKLVYLDHHTRTQLTNDGKAILNWSPLPRNNDVDILTHDLFETGVPGISHLENLWFTLTLVDESLYGLECRELFENHGEKRKDTERIKKDTDEKGIRVSHETENSTPCTTLFNPQTYIKRHCTSCHDKNIGPDIPFQDLGEIQKWLSEPIPGSGKTLWESLRYRLNPKTPSTDRMPMDGSPLTEEQYKDVMEFFGQLKQKELNSSGQ